MNRTFSTFVLAGAVLVSARAQPFSSKAEKIPASVIVETRQQVLRCFGTNNIRGVPLLDQTVEWNWFTNWPDEFMFEGDSYRLRLTDTSGGDYSVPLTSRVAVRPGMSFLAQYGGPNSGLPLGIAGGWNADGSINAKSVDYPRIVFSHQFHPMGRLYYFARYDAATNYLVDWFDARGELVGTMRGGTLATTKPVTFRWRGREVDHKEFFEEQRKSYRDFAR